MNGWYLWGSMREGIVLKWVFKEYDCGGWRGWVHIVQDRDSCERGMNLRVPWNGGNF